MAALQIPLAVWKNNIHLDVSCTLACIAENTIHLGLSSGRIARLSIDNERHEISLEMFLYGHVNTIVALVCANFRGDQEDISVLLSLDRKGEMSLWSVRDGRCLLHNVMAIDGEARGMCASPNGEFIFVYGHSSSVNILKSNTLEVVQSIPLPAALWIDCAAVIGTNNIYVILFPLTGSVGLTFIFDEVIGKAVTELTSLEFISTSECEPIPCSSMVRQCLSVETGGVFVADMNTCWFGSLMERGRKFAGRVIHRDLNSPIARLTNHGPAGCILEKHDGSLVIIDSGKDQPRSLKPLGLKRDHVYEIFSWNSIGIIAVQFQSDAIKVVQLERNTSFTAKPISKVDGVTCSTVCNYKGEFKVIHGYSDGSIQIMSVLDGFVAFSGVLRDRTTLPHCHQHQITCLAVDTDELLVISGDASGLIAAVSMETNQIIGSLQHHFNAIVAMVKVSSDRILAIDDTGRCSLINIERFSFHGFLGARNQPVKAIKWTNDIDNLRICVVFCDDKAQIWNITLGNCEKECSLSLAGLEEILRPFSNQLNIVCPRQTPNGILLPFDHNILGTAITWRPILWSDPIQIAIFDIRRLIDTVKELFTRSTSDDLKARVMEVLSFVLSLLLPWRIDPEVDAYSHRMGFGRPRGDIVIGMIGANGNVAFSSPSAAHKVWSLSGTMCATVYLAISSIFEIPFDFGEDWDRLRMSMTSRFFDAHVGIIPLPSFAFTSKFWHDLNEELRHASRLMIVQTLARLNRSTLESIATYWTLLLPTNEKGDGRKMNRAAIILGILGVHQADILSEDTRKLVADSLMNLLMDEKRNLFRAAAIELIGKAFPVWEQYIQALSVFRLLLAWLVSMSQIDESGPVVQLVVPFENAATLDTLDAVRGTLLKIASVATNPILSQWLGHDFAMARSVVEKWTTISLLSDLIRQRPAEIKSCVPLIAETACKLVESGGSLVGSTKQRMMSIAMPLILDLLNAFPTVAYHREVFRLAAAADNKIIICDLRGLSATRQLEGHTKPITCIGFSPDGRILLSYSFEEATLRWWQVPSTLSGLLGGVVKPYKTDVVEPALTEAMLSHLEQLSDGTIENTRFQWTEDRQVQIFVADAVLSIVSIATN